MAITPAIKNGFALILLVLIIPFFFIISTLLVSIIYNCFASNSFLLQREAAFWLAEGGLEKGKVELAQNPNWYTDLPGPDSVKTEWLTSSAKGEDLPLGDGGIKIVREKDKNHFYGIGFKSKAIVILQVNFTNPPFKIIKWQEI